MIDPDTQKLLLGIIVSLSVLFLTVYYVFLPAIRSSYALTKQIKEKKVDTTKIQIASDEFEKLAKKINGLRQQSGTLDEKLYWEEDISKFLDKLTQLAADLNIEFVSLKPESVIQPPKSKDKKDKKESRENLLAQVPITVSFKASYSNLVEFLKRIEEADKFIKIDTFSIESEQKEIHKHNIKMLLVIYIKGHAVSDEERK